ncbi:MAG: outer membrane protein assembly factor BamA [Desulfocapsaceae bacterium]|nr:outer membrane protein assembly factor BamA [Desulfocapsaceae bacterium]
MVLLWKRGTAASRQRINLPRMVCVLLFALHLPFLVTQAKAADHNTVFFPLKINSPTNMAELAKTADAGLTQACQTYNLTMLDRAAAAKMVDYNGTWPPSAKELQRVAATTGMGTVAVGTLTAIGSQISIDVKVFNPLTTVQYYTRQANSMADVPDSLKAIARDIAGSSTGDTIISSITPEGNKNIDSGAILRRIKSKVGDVYNPSILQEDLKSIYQMGFFEDVQIDVRDGAKGKDIIFRTVEKPIISSITYSGISALDEKDVKEAANIKEQTILNLSKINSTVESIRTFYKSKGYYNTTITPKITYPAASNAEVVFAINEGKKIYIKEIRFRGNASFKNSELEDVMKTSTKWMFSWLTEAGVLDMDQLKHDSDSIVAFYANNGFLDAKISDPIITQDADYLYVTFDVDEGQRYSVGTIDFQGDLITDKQTLIDLMSVRNEKYLSRKALRDDILKIQDLYGESGFAFVDVRPDLRKSEDGKRFDIVLNIKKGDLVYINRITIKGNSRTRDNVIRRELKVSEGGVFDSKALRTSSEKLQRLDFFEDVSLIPQPTGDPAKMNVDIDVKEKSTGRFSVGVGYSSVDQVVLMGQISEDNFMGLGDKLAFTASTGSTNKQMDLSFTNPHVNDSALSSRTDLFNIEQEYTSYTTNTKGGSQSFGYPIWGDWRGIAGYKFTDTHLSNVAANAPYLIIESENIHTTSQVSYSIRKDLRDKVFNTTKGSNNAITVSYAGGPFGGDSQFTKLEGDTSWYFPVLYGTVFHIRGSAGEAWANTPNGLPVFERYFLGGINTIRGFKFATVSPKDLATGDYIGGNKMWFTNTEFLFPLAPSQGVQGVAFYDMGRVFNDDEKWSLNGIRKSAGLGINWYSPLGPLRLECGINLDPQTGEERVVWDFTMGGSF